MASRSARSSARPNFVERRRQPHESGGQNAAAAAAPEQRASGERFDWHPEFTGKTVSEVRTTLTNELASDQRAYALALEGAEEHENATLATVLDLEKKWGRYDLDWATADPSTLASHIVGFEQEREQRQEMIPYAAYRERSDPAAGTTLTTGAAGRGAPPASPAFPIPPVGLAIVAVVIVVILLVMLL